MSEFSTKKPNAAWQGKWQAGLPLLGGLVAATVLVILKLPSVASAMNSIGLPVGLGAVVIALVVTCLLIRWIGSAPPALLFVSVCLVSADYVPRETAARCLHTQLADPFVIIVFAGFALTTLLFGMPAERGIPPRWALRPGELVGRGGELLRSGMGRFCLRLLSDRQWARLGALLLGFLITPISSVLGADAMARMAAIPAKSPHDDAGSASPTTAEEQDRRIVVFVLLACVLSPALIPVSLWGLFFSQAAGDLSRNASANAWLLISYPALMALVLPFWFCWRFGTKRKTFFLYITLYLLAWGIVVAFAALMWRWFGLVDCPEVDFKDHVTRGKEKFAQFLLGGVVFFSASRIAWRCWKTLPTRPPAAKRTVFQPLNQWVINVEWELVKGGFSRALGVVVIVVFAVIFREVISTTMPASAIKKDTAYRWQATAFSRTGTESAPSDWLYFSTRDSVVSVGAPVAIGPGTTTNADRHVASLKPRLRWKPVEGAARYGVYVSKRQDGNTNLVYSNLYVHDSSLVLPPDPAASELQPSSRATVLESGTTYCWWMTAFGSTGAASTPSRYLYFSTSNAVSVGAPTALWPGNAADMGDRIPSLAPTLAWSAVSNAVRYGVVLSKYPYGTTDVVYSNLNVRGTSLALPANRELGCVVHFPFTAVIVWLFSVWLVGMSIGTAFGTFVLGAIMVRIMWPSGLPLQGQSPIVFWMLVSISAAVNQISPQADNVDALGKYMTKRHLTREATTVVLPVLGIAVAASLVGWLYCGWATVSGLDVMVGLSALCAGAIAIAEWRRSLGTTQEPSRVRALCRTCVRWGSAQLHARPAMKQFLPVSSPSSSSLLDKPPADKGQTRKLLLWLGVHGQSATNLVEESRLAGEFAANYDEDNDSANIKGDEKGALLRTVPLMGDDAWKLSETHTKPDTLLLLVDPETGITDLLDSPLVARSLCDGKPLVRVVRLLLDGAGVPPAAGPLLNRIGGGAIRDYRGRSGLRSLSEGIVECLNYREGIGAKPPLHDWLFPAGAAREVGSGMMEPNASVPTNAI